MRRVIDILAPMALLASSARGQTCQTPPTLVLPGTPANCCTYSAFQLPTETCGNLAARNGITFAELVALNPGITTLLCATANIGVPALYSVCVSLAPPSSTTGTGSSVPVVSPSTSAVVPPVSPSSTVQVVTPVISPPVISPVIPSISITPVIPSISITPVISSILSSIPAIITPVIPTSLLSSLITAVVSPSAPVTPGQCDVRPPLSQLLAGASATCCHFAAPAVLDSCDSFAARYGLTVAQLQSLNGGIASLTCTPGLPLVPLPIIQLCINDNPASTTVTIPSTLSSTGSVSTATITVSSVSSVSQSSVSSSFSVSSVSSSSISVSTVSSSSFSVSSVSSSSISVSTASSSSFSSVSSVSASSSSSVVSSSAVSSSASDSSSSSVVSSTDISSSTTDTASLTTATDSTVSSTVSVTSSASSVAPTNPPVVGFTFFLSFQATLPLRMAKRAVVTYYLRLNIDGTVSATLDCAQATQFVIIDGRLTVPGLNAFISPTLLTLGAQPLAFGPTNPTNIEREFSNVGGLLDWTVLGTALGPVSAKFIAADLGGGNIKILFTFDDPVLPPNYNYISIISQPGAGSACLSPPITSSVPVPTGPITAPPAVVTTTVYSTIIYIVTRCPKGGKGCHPGQTRTDTVPVYTTVYHGHKPSYPSHDQGNKIGIIVNVMVDVTVEITIKNGQRFTKTNYEAIGTATADLWDNGSEDQPCYACQLEAVGKHCPKTGVVVTRTIVHHKPTHVPCPEYPPVIKTCDKCDLIVLDPKNVAVANAGNIIIGDNNIIGNNNVNGNNNVVGTAGTGKTTPSATDASEGVSNSGNTVTGNGNIIGNNNVNGNGNTVATAGSQPAPTGSEPATAGSAHSTAPESADTATPATEADGSASSAAPGTDVVQVADAPAAAAANTPASTEAADGTTASEAADGTEANAAPAASNAAGAGSGTGASPSTASGAKSATTSTAYLQANGATSYKMCGGLLVSALLGAVILL